MSDYKLIPDGLYNVCVKNFEDRESNKSVNKNAIYTKITFEIVEGEFKNRKLWKNLNLINPNNKAVQIAYKDLKNILDACCADSLFNCIDVIFIGKVVQIKDFRDDTKMVNEIKGFYSIEKTQIIDLNNEEDLNF